MLIDIAGTTVDTQHTQLNVAGAVDLTGVDLVLNVTVVPVVGNTFTIVNNDGMDAVIGRFTGLPNSGSIVTAGAVAFSTTGGPGGNVIAFNSANPGGDPSTGGVVVVSGTGNRILGNSIFSNTGLGIELELPGVLANDAAPDADTGTNNLQNFPVINSALASGGMTSVNVTLTSAFSTNFVIEFFRNTTADASGNGEGKTFLGSTTQMTNAAGTVTFSLSLPAVPAGEFITATATDSGNNTSEFSAAVAVTATAALGRIIVNKVTNPGGDPQVFS